jgi:hypothetical protein
LITIRFAPREGILTTPANYRPTRGVSLICAARRSFLQAGEQHWVVRFVDGSGHSRENVPDQQLEQERADFLTP